MSHPLLVGVDVLRKTNTVCLMDGQGCQIVHQAVAGNFDAIHIAAEATGWY